ncbi:hypothetical protein Avbf_15484 [Armadillidium vulgare]|nr:hypothetical protein Avbf_15484 [Armadillidium vulgare]
MLDFYGTFRGKCKECSCIEYVTENNSIKCAYCDHSPSKHEIKPESSSNETCDEEAVFQNVSVSPDSVPTDIDLPSTSFCETQRDKIENSIEEPVAEKMRCLYKFICFSSNYTNCVMKDIVDGSNFSVHPGSAQCRERNVEIFLYMDEKELCNPLGRNRDALALYQILGFKKRFSPFVIKNCHKCNEDSRSYSFKKEYHEQCSLRTFKEQREEKIELLRTSNSLKISTHCQVNGE